MDSNDVNRMEEAKWELMKITNETGLRNVPLLVLANKQVCTDIQHVLQNPNEISDSENVYCTRMSMGLSLPSDIMHNVYLEYIER